MKHCRKGRIASIYFDRPGNRDGIGELRIADPDGGHGTEILPGRDLADIGIGCGGDRPPAGPWATRVRRPPSALTAEQGVVIDIVHARGIRRG